MCSLDLDLGITNSKEHYECFQGGDPGYCTGGHAAKLVAFIVCLENTDAYHVVNRCIIRLHGKTHS